MRWYLTTPGSPKCILPVAQSTSITPVSPYTHSRALRMYQEAVIEWDECCTRRPRSSVLRDALGGQDRVNSEKHSEAMIMRVWRCAWRPWSCELRDAFGGRDRVNSEMHLEARIDWTQRYTPRPWSSEFGDALEGQDRVNSEMHFEAVIMRGWSCNWRLRLHELRDALGGRDWVSLEMLLEAMIERHWRNTWKRWIWREAQRQLKLYSLVNLWMLECRELSTKTSSERWETGWERQTVDHGMMLYLMYAVLGVKLRSWHGEIERDDLTSCS